MRHLARSTAAVLAGTVAAALAGGPVAAQGTDAPPGADAGAASPGPTTPDAGSPDNSAPAASGPGSSPSFGSPARIGSGPGLGAAVPAIPGTVPVLAPGVTASTGPQGYVPADAPQIVSPLASSPLLPGTGFSGGTRVGDLRSQVAQAVGLPELQPALGPAFTLTPRIGLSQEYTDAGAYTASGRPRSAFITILQPGIAVQGQTRRLQVNLDYDPEVYLYDTGGGQNYVAQNLNGQALVTLVPQALFVDVRAFATQQSIFGGYGPNGVSSLPTNGAQQDFSVSVSPYLVHRFGTLGTGEVGYTYARTVQDDANRNGTLLVATPFGVIPVAQAAAQTNQNVTTHNVHAAFETGEAFGRYNGTALATASFYHGSGVLADAHRDIFSIDNGYAIDHNLTLLAQIGYENIRYSGTAPIRVSDVLWDGGVRWRPAPDTTVTARYGHHDGLNALTLDAAVAPTPRTRLYLRYSAGLSTEGEALQNALASTDLDALGNPVDHSSGAPVFFASNFFGTQNNLERVHRLSISGVYLLDRDSFTLQVENDDSKVISAGSTATAFAALSNSGTYGSLAWQHDLSSRLHSTLYAQYGVRSNAGAGPGVPTTGSSSVVTASAGMSYLIGEGFSGTVNYTYQRGGAVVQGQGAQSQNVVLLGVVKAF